MDTNTIKMETKASKMETKTQLNVFLSHSTDDFQYKVKPQTFVSYYILQYFPQGQNRQALVVLTVSVEHS